MKIFEMTERHLMSDCLTIFYLLSSIFYFLPDRLIV